VTRSGLLRAVEAAARRLDLPGRRVLVAVSGGVDSVVLLHALHQLAGPLALELAVGHVHHGLRGEAADADQRLVLETAQRLGWPAAASRVDPRSLRAAGPSRSRPTLQEAARRLRYQALEELARQADCAHLATAHTEDDQAETVLLRLLRGSGPDGLGGIPERSPDGRVVRPLLGVSRAAIEAFARARGIAWREDPSNADPAYARSRLRARWLPGLAAEFNPRLLRRLADLAEAQRRDAEWMAAAVAAEAARRFAEEEEGALSIARAGWERVPEALARRLVRSALARAGGGRDVSRVHLERALRFLRGGRTGTAIELPGGLRLACERERFRLETRKVRLQGSC
jgi:tRNA(Ile)-lysidine synthase